MPELPPPSATLREPTPPLATPAVARVARVLVIDDEPIMGRCIARLLRGHDVRAVRNGLEGLATLREGELPDLVLCDLMMPEWTGVEVFAALERERPEVLPRLVFMTGGTFTPELEAFLDGHPWMRVINKPFEVGQLEGLVARSLGQAPRPSRPT